MPPASSEKREETMHTTLIQKARAGRVTALNTLRHTRDLTCEFRSVRRLPEILSNEFSAMFDATQHRFG